MRRFQEAVLTFIFPKRCPFCGRVITPREAYCVSCGKQLPEITKDCCLHCGMPREACACHKRKQFLSGITAPFYYQGPVRQGVLRMKFGGKLTGVPLFAERMAVRLDAVYGGVRFDAATYVPMYWKKEKERGYNQARLLAEGVAGRKGLPLEACLQKTTDTPPQHELPFDKRRGNLMGVFAVSQAYDLKGKTILLCDDVFTSGATLNECAKMLLMGGAQAVYGLTLAITRRKTKPDKRVKDDSYGDRF